MSRRTAATHGDAGTAKLMTHGGPGNTQLGTIWATFGWMSEDSARPQTV